VCCPADGPLALLDEVTSQEKDIERSDRSIFAKFTHMLLEGHGNLGPSRQKAMSTRDMDSGIKEIGSPGLTLIPPIHRHFLCPGRRKCDPHFKFAIDINT
jgi:hypothetical protein